MKIEKESTLCLRIKFFLAVYGIWPLIHQFLDYPNMLSQLLTLPLGLCVLLYGKKKSAATRPCISSIL